MARMDVPLEEMFIGEFDDDGFELEQDATCVLAPSAWPRPPRALITSARTPRQNVLRTVLSVALFVAAGLALAGGPRLAGSLLRHLASTGPATGMGTAARPLELLRARLPIGAWRNPAVRIAPVNGPENAAYACWIDEPGWLAGQEPGKVMLAAFDAGQQTWRMLVAPAAEGASCDVAADLDGTASAVVAVGRSQHSGNTCPLPDLYLTEDGGRAWHGVPWPADAGAACQITVTLEGGRLYVLADARLMGTSSPGESGHLLVTADGGGSWRAADADLGDVTDFTPVAYRPGGHVLAQAAEPGSLDRVVLFESTDAGAHWTNLGPAPGMGTRVFASSDPAATNAGGWGRLYAYGTSDGAATPGADGGVLWAYGAARPTWTPTGLDEKGSAVRTWTVIAAPPDASTTFTIPAGMWLADAGEGPRQALLMSRARLGVASNVTLSLWVGQGSSPTEYALPQNALVQAVSWYHGQMRLWATMARAGQGRELRVAVFTLRPQS